jgi:outer membrane biosynthesis protein TonB
MRCKAGARESKVSVKIRFRLNSDGSVAGIPEVLNSSGDPLFPSTAQSAVSAVQGCGPYDFLPADRYDLWQDNTFDFNPNMMFGI